MSSNRNLLVTWIEEAKKEINQCDDNHNELRIDYERFKTKIETRNKFIWGMITFLFMASGAIVTWLTFFKK